MNKKMFVDERRFKIVDYVKNYNHADVEALARELDVTEATIRRDLVFLEKRRLIYRTHGGVIQRHDSPAFWHTTRIEERLIVHREEKERIADFIAQLVNDNDSVIFDGGSSTLLVAEKLVDKTDLVIVTNSPAIGSLFLRRSGRQVILLGGEFIRDTDTTIGTITEAELRNIRVDKAVMGATAVLPEEGFFCSFPAEAGVKRRMIQAAREVILACDSSKINSRGLCCFNNFEKIGKFVTDKNISPEALSVLGNQGIDVITV
jgi:DeoR family transcriptional regulator of aga operon/DeoR family fructose operon transcriptional repressor